MADSPVEAVTQPPFVGTRKDWMFGVIVPALALAFELSTRACADLYFDPLPTWTAVLGVAAVPVLFGLWLMRIRRGQPISALHRLLLFAVLGFAGAYVLALNIILVLGIITLVILGFGLLPLSPLGVLILALVRCRHWLRPADGPVLTLRSAFVAIALGFGFGIGPFAAESYVAYALNAAAKNKPDEARFGLRLLRLASPEYVAKVCGNPVHPLLAIRVPSSTAQSFFRAFGVPIQEVAGPSTSRQEGGRLRSLDDRWDSYLGGTQVGSKRRDVRLVDNRMDVRVDAGSGTAQVEWEFTWENTGRVQDEEARLLFHVPGAGAATRLTLWVAGEPQEAAFGPRGQVRQAYQQVAVQQRRDPALLTTCGPDRVLLQCFPIPREQTLKVRVGLTLPFEPGGTGGSSLPLPVVEAANFIVEDSATVPLWVEGGESLVLQEGGVTSSDALPRSLTWARLRRGDLAFAAKADLARPGRVSGDEREPGVLVRETARMLEAPKTWVLVVDGSAPTGKRLEELAATLEKLPGPFSVWWAGEPREHLPAASGHEAAVWLRAQHPIGGQDPAEVLAEAWDEAAGLGATLVWLHGALPLTWQQSGSLRQRLERRPDAVPLQLVAIAPGENLLVAELDGFSGAIETWSALDEGEVRRVLETLGAVRKVRAWESLEEAQQSREQAVQRAEPAVRLWLAQRLGAERSSEARAGLVRLATRLGVVTSHTGAVVLEQAADYERHKLEQQDPMAVPQVPEPAQVALVSGAVVLGYAVVRRKRQSGFRVS